MLGTPRQYALYLAGPMTQVGEEDRNAWRRKLKNEFSGRVVFRDPTEFVFPLETAEDAARLIAQKERELILHSDAVLARLDPPSMGTAMGVMYGFMTHRLVIGVVPEGSLGNLSPMVRHHLTAITHEFSDAVQTAIDLLQRSSIRSLQTRDGMIVPFSVRNIEFDIQAAIESALEPSLFQEVPPAARLAQAVANELETLVAAGTIECDYLNSDVLEETVETVLMHNAHRPEVLSVARAYIRRRANRRDSENLRVVESEILHGVKGKIGNVLRECNDAQLAFERRELKVLADSLTSIRVNGERALSLIVDARQRVRGVYQEEAVPLAALLRDLQAQCSGCRFDISLVSADVSVRTVRFKLGSALENIVDNAIKHGFEFTADPLITIRTSQTKDGLGLYISNNGSPLTSPSAASGPSWGLGRSHILKLADEMGSSVVVSHSSPEGGPSYTFTFPVDRVVLKPSARIILVADDDEEDRRHVAKRLQSAGFEVAEAEDPERAYYQLTRLPEVYGVVLDVDFRTSKDGFWLLQKIRDSDKLRHIRAVVVSGSSKPQWREKAQLLDAVALDKGSYANRELLETFQ